MAELSQKQTLTEGAVALSNKWIQGAVNPAHKGDLHKALHVAAGEKIPKAKINKATHSSDPHLRHMAQFAKNVAPKQEGVGEGDTSSPTKTTGGRANMPTSDVRSKYYPPAKPPVKKFAQPTTAFDRNKTGGLSTAYAQDQASRPAGMNPSPESRYKIGEEGGIPMTAKQKSFAALAPPKDKITFADKIAGAKQEVEEMLGDVAAEAIKSALTPKQKKLDRNNNGKLDAQDFEMLRKGAKQETDEGWDEMERDVKKRMGPKVGDVRRGARHDIETTATGVRATRRYDDEEDDNQPTGEKRKAGRPKGSRKAMGAKGPSGRSKLMTREDGVDIVDRGEYDQEGAMAKDDIKTIVRHAQALEKILGDNDNLPEWVQAKLAKIEGMMTAVDDYMQNQQDDDQEIDEKAPLGAKAERMVKHIKAGYAKDGKLTDVEKRKAYGAAWKAHNAGKVEEESTDKEDQRAERAGRKVAKDIEYDEGHKGKDDNRAEKAGKRVTKDIEYDDKKDRKEKKVDETTTSGSVAASDAAPKKSKGGMQIGKGIYDSMNRELENMISESMSINVSMTNDDSGSHKNITVTAADEDAEMLAQLLARAGLTGGAHGHQEPCPDCGSTDCGCDEAVEEAYGDVTATENKPDWPTDTEYSDDALQYSGGLNKPKTDVAGDGQTTVPNTAVHTQDEDELRRMMEMAGIDQSKLKPWERTMKEEEAVEEGVVDTVKSVVKKGLEKLGHGSDQDMRKDLQKKMGVPPTGQKPEPKDDKKMQESLMKEFANFKI